MKQWADIEAFYERLSRSPRAHVSPIQTLLAWLRSHNLCDQLHAFTSMQDLVVSDQPKTGWDQHTLRISTTSAGDRVLFRYSRHDGATDVMTKEVDALDAPETLRQFLTYKFGIYEKKEA